MITKKSNHAVSEVLSIVLLLGITIALFGFLNYVVFSFSFEPSAPSVNLIGSVEKTQNNITIDHHGGESLQGATKIIITIGSNTSQHTISDIITGVSGWKLLTSPDDKNPDKWDFGETVQFSSPYDLTDTYIQTSVMDPTSNTLLLSTVLQQGPTTSIITNKPPTVSSPLPTNGSPGNLLSFTWSIQINDPEGDPFTWTIQCSNGQTSNGAGPNGQKTLDLSGLAYSTSYKIWVNATDPAGSNEYTRKWYSFTTGGNLPPAFGTPTPANTSTGQPVSLTWSIPINDPEGNTFTWTIQCSNGQSNSGIGASNGTKTVVLSGLAYSTMYKIWVNATDPSGSGVYMRRWYTFTTIGSGNPPIFGAPSPANDTKNQPLSFTWSIPINDPEGNTFTWTIQCNNSQTNSGTGATNGTKSLTLTGLLGGKTRYKVWVNATDPSGSGLYTRHWYIFTTRP